MDCIVHPSPGLLHSYSSPFCLLYTRAHLVPFLGFPKISWVLLKCSYDSTDHQVCDPLDMISYELEQQDKEQQYWDGQQKPTSDSRRFFGSSFAMSGGSTTCLYQHPANITGRHQATDLNQCNFVYWDDLNLCTASSTLRNQYAIRKQIRFRTHYLDTKPYKECNAKKTHLRDA
jgi:hypothetical protein